MAYYGIMWCNVACIWKKTKNTNGRIYLSITDSYYDKEKKTSRSKTIESIGYLDELEKQYKDPIAHFQKRVEYLRLEKSEKQIPVNFSFSASDKLSIGDAVRKNFGYAALSKIYHELEIHKFLINRQRNSKEQYDANTILKMLVYSRILAPASKKHPLRTVDISLKKQTTLLMMFTVALRFLKNTGKTFRYG